MPARASRLSLLLAVLLALTACDGGEPGPGEGTLEVGPRGPEDIVQHLVDPPAYPAPVTDDAELAELRNPEGNNRHQAYLAELEASGTLDGELVRGSLVRLAAGSELTIPDGASIARLDGDAIVEVGSCPAPCEVAGPALVAPARWLPGIGAAAGWQLLVPAPEA